MIRKVPGPRGGVVTVDTRGKAPLLTVSGDEVRVVKDVLVGLFQEFGIGVASVKGDAEVTFRIDFRAMLLAPIYEHALRQSKLVGQEAQVTADQLAGSRLRARALAVLLNGLQVFLAELLGSRLVIAAAQGRVWQDSVDALQKDLAGEKLSLDERTQLKKASGEVLLRAEQEQAQQQQRRDELKGAREAAQAKVAEATARRRKLQALLGLQEADEVDPAMLDELLAIYEGKLRMPGEEQRKASR